MSTDPREEIQAKLDELFKQIEISRRLKAEQTQIDQQCNFFEMEWLDRLKDQQKAAIADATEALRNTSAERALQHQQKSDRTDAQKLPGMAPDDQTAFWMSNRTGSNAYREQEQARELNADIAREQKRINREYETLRQALTKSVQQIEVGEKPSLTLQIARLVENTERTINPLPWKTDGAEERVIVTPPIKRTGLKR